MLKAILKAFAKVLIAVVLVRLGILAFGVDTLVRETTGGSFGSLDEIHAVGREALDTLGRVLAR